MRKVPRQLDSLPARPGRRAREAFTLIEMLAVIGILGLLMAILLPTLGMARREAKRKATVSFLQSLSSALEQFKTEWGEYPRSDGRLEAKPTPPMHSGNQPRVGGELLVDFLCGPDDRYRYVENVSQPTELRYVWLADSADLQTEVDAGKLRPRSGMKKINVPGVQRFGRTMGPYFEFSPKRVRTFVVEAQGMGPGQGEGRDAERVMFVDTWGGPILYWRAQRGVLGGDANDVFPWQHNEAVLESAQYKGIGDNEWYFGSNRVWQRYLRADPLSVDEASRDTVGRRESIPDRDRFLLISAGRNGQFGWPGLAIMHDEDPRTRDTRQNDDVVSNRIEEY